MGDLPIRPLRLSLDLGRRIDEAFEELIHAPWGREQLASSVWQPAVDIYEVDDAYLIEADLPGVPPERVEVHAEDSRLTFRGMRETVTSGWSATGRTLLVERRQGQFCRTIEFERPVDTNRVEMQFDRGTLRIRVPKRTMDTA